MTQKKIEPSPSELLAFQLVGSELGVEVVPYDDNSQPRMVDALIPPDGALEVIADVDSEFSAMWSKLGKSGHTVGVQILKHLWIVGVKHSTRIKALEKALPGFLAELEHRGITSTMDAPIRRHGPTGGVQEQMEALGVTHAHHDGTERAGAVRFQPVGWSGVAGLGDNVLAGWVSAVLTEQDDVAPKLRDQPGVTQRHAFIWATIGSDYAIQSYLEDEGPVQPSMAAPKLPEGITHIWIAGSMSSQGAVAWFPDQGWWRTAWRVPISDRAREVQAKIAAAWPFGLDPSK